MNRNNGIVMGKGALLARMKGKRPVSSDEFCENPIHKQTWGNVSYDAYVRKFKEAQEKMIEQDIRQVM